MSEWFGASFTEISRVVISTLAIYVTVLAGLRLAGRRTVSQMSAFDFVVTIAIGSLVATTAVSAQPSYGRGLAALLSLLVAQQAVAVIRQRVPPARRLLDFSPQTLYRDGELELRHNPLTAQVTESEFHSRLRRAGIGSVEEAKVVILEPDGSVSVMRSVDEDRRLWNTAMTDSGADPD